MPIRPENRARYPKDWKQISHRIRFDRARGKCEWCPAVHGQPHPVTGSRVVLTVAHMDHTPENCADENLVALCQKCHNAYDAPTRVANRRARLQAPAVPVVTGAVTIDEMMHEFAWMISAHGPETAAPMIEDIAQQRTGIPYKLMSTEHLGEPRYALVDPRPLMADHVTAKFTVEPIDA